MMGFSFLMISAESMEVFYHKALMSRSVEVWFWDCLAEKRMEFFILMRWRGGVWEILSMLEMGLERNAPIANLKPVLCIVSMNFKWEEIVLMKKRKPYSNLDSMIDLYIWMRDNEFTLHEVWTRNFSVLILFEDDFLSFFKCVI